MPSSKLSICRASCFVKRRAPRRADSPARSQRLRFVIQKHAARRLHYDLRLELDGVFKSWAVTRGPSLDPADKRLAVEVEDHPLDYGDFEGTIPQGQYGGGTVQLWDRGCLAALPGTSRRRRLSRPGELKFTLDGERLHGSWVLVRIRNDRGSGKRSNWLLIKHRDEAADAEAGAQVAGVQDRSVASRTQHGDHCGRSRQGPEAVHCRTSSREAKADAIWQIEIGIRHSRPQLKDPCRASSSRQLCTLVERPPGSAGLGA